MRRPFMPTWNMVFLGVFALGVLRFLPAWTLNYWQAWLFIAVFVGTANAIGVYLALNDQEFIERRTHVGPTAETNVAQKIIMSVAVLSCVALLMISAFDHRFGWSMVPAPVAVAGDVPVALGFLIVLLVFKKNSFGSSTIQFVEGHRVISTGPYAIVRHPMYVGVLVMAIGVPLALGSWWGLALLVLTIVALVWRILDEEQLLVRDLPGYRAYPQWVRYRLVPHLW